MNLCETSDVDSGIQKIKDENVSLTFQVSSLVKEREHIKLEYKKLYDLIKQTRAHNKLTTDSLQQRLNDQISESAKNNKDVHQDYLRVNKGHVETLHELLEEARALKPLDEHIGYASKFVERIQELLVYVVEIVLWYLDSRFSKYMTGQRDKLLNFVSKFIGTFRFGNNHFAAIIAGQFYNSDLEVAFRKHTCFIRNLDGVDLLSGSRGSKLYTISIKDMMKSSPICLLSKASKIESWLWHRRLSHLNFNTIKSLQNKILLEAEVVATACYTQNRSLVHTYYDKTPYEMLRGCKPDLKFLYVFNALCYPTNDYEDLGKLQLKADIIIFIGYSLSKKAYRI
ncbi:integrase, catalytic region, zinc finger, CCHC-type containing protein [Tanacetum coccineum]